MDFEKVLGHLVVDFDQKEISYALIGGFALGALGIIRATMDLDFLVRKDQLMALNEIMMHRGYKLAFTSEDVSQYVSGLKPFGNIDFIHAFRPLSLEMLDNAARLPLFRGTLTIPVVRPEDIIGLKVQSLTNNPERREIDTADIVLLMKEFADGLDWNKLKRYFELFQETDMFDELEGRFGGK